MRSRQDHSRRHLQAETANDQDPGPAGRLQPEPCLADILDRPWADLSGSERCLVLEIFGTGPDWKTALRLAPPPDPFWRPDPGTDPLIAAQVRWRQLSWEERLAAARALFARSRWAGGARPVADLTDEERLLVCALDPPVPTVRPHDTNPLPPDLGSFPTISGPDWTLTWALDPGRDDVTGERLGWREEARTTLWVGRSAGVPPVPFRIAWQGGVDPRERDPDRTRHTPGRVHPADDEENRTYCSSYYLQGPYLISLRTVRRRRRVLGQSPLQGSQKQVAWAGEIRTRFWPDLESYVARQEAIPELPSARQGRYRQALDRLDRHRDARWWIDRRDRSARDLIEAEVRALLPVPRTGGS